MQPSTTFGNFNIINDNRTLFNGKNELLAFYRLSGIPRRPVSALFGADTGTYRPEGNDAPQVDAWH
jgi:hypothetical protein